MLPDAALRNAVTRADTLEPYEAFDLLWTALLQVANDRQEPTEQRRVLALVRQLSPAALTRVARAEPMTHLMTLDPPLETLQVNPHEDLYPQETARAFATIIANDIVAPDIAIIGVGEILKRVRNKRAHGFKSTDPATRDGDILRSATGVLRQLCTELVNAGS